MKITLVVFMSLLTIFCSSCSHKVEPLPTEEKPPVQPHNFNEDLKYFPLKAGNFWKYKYTEVWHDERDTLIYNMEVLKDTVFADGKTYWKVGKTVIYSVTGLWNGQGYVLTNNPADSAPRISFIRTDSDNGNIYNTVFSNGKLSEEVLIDSTASKVNNYFKCYLPTFYSSNWWTVYCKDISEGTVLGMKTTIKTYSESTYLRTGADHKWAKGIGFFKLEKSSEPAMGIYGIMNEDLLYARIDNIEYKSGNN